MADQSSSNGAVAPVTRRSRNLMLAGGAASGLLIPLAIAWAMPGAAAGKLDSNQVRAALAARLPKTKISDVDCSKLSGICEVTAGPNVFYTDAAARYLVIGRVYDMQTRQDLTAARLLQMSPETLVKGAAQAQASEEGEGGPAPRPADPKPVNLSELPKDGAIRWGAAQGPKLVVFSDLHCTYCKALSGELAKAGFSVEERPISVLGTRQLSEAVYCAKDPVAALHGAYDGREPARSGKCDTRGLDANESFAKRHGFNGTPVIVRPSDGAVIDGYRTAPVLVQFAKGGAA